MSSTVGFDWPKPLRAVRAAAEAGTLPARCLYPVEIKAICDLVAGVPLDETPREIAPGVTAARREQSRDPAQDELSRGQRRAAYFFIGRFPNGRIWQCSLFSEWREVSWHSRDDRRALHTLSPRYIVHAVTRSVESKGAGHE